MEVAEAKHSSGYGKAPWVFKGSALYQLHLVKAETARACIPKELKLVEAFGYTLGGFFLANYEDSPAGAFDELVVMAGIVWNPPTSCAWAARVLVSSDDACDHGRKEVGLPSHVAMFSKHTTAAIARRRTSKPNHLLRKIGFGSSLSRPDDLAQVTEINGRPCSSNINITTLDRTMKLSEWMGPAIRMSLPSFSGRTEHNPTLLKYSCDIECRVRAVQPAKVSVPFPSPDRDKEGSLDRHNRKTAESGAGQILDNLSMSVMLSKPILALEFSKLRMQVEAPNAVYHRSNTSSSTSFGVS